MARTEGCELTLEWPELGSTLAEILSRLSAIEARLDEQQNGSEWYDVKSASVYLRDSVGAVRSAERLGRLKGYRNASGRLRFKRSDLDAYNSAE